MISLINLQLGNTMNVYDQAHGLAKAIKASEEFKQYDRTKQLVAQNSELDKMLKDFQQKQFEIQAKQMMGEQLTPEMMASVQELYSIVLKDPLAAEHLQNEMRFSIMMKDVYQIIGEATGMGDLIG